MCGSVGRGICKYLKPVYGFRKSYKAGCTQPLVSGRSDGQVHPASGRSDGHLTAILVSTPHRPAPRKFEQVALFLETGDVF